MGAALQSPAGQGGCGRYWELRDRPAVIVHYDV